MTARNENGPQRREGDEQDRRHWRAFWDEMPGWVRTLIVAGSAGVSVQGGNMVLKHSTGSDSDDVRKVIREELAPLKAGFTAFVQTRPDKEQVLIFRAMSRKREEREN